MTSHSFTFASSRQNSVKRVFLGWDVVGSCEMPLLSAFPTGKCAGCWKLGCWGWGTGVLGTPQGFGSCFHGPGSNSDVVKLTNKLTLVQSIVALGDLLMLQQYFSITLALWPARCWLWLYNHPDLHHRFPEQQLRMDVLSLQLRPGWQSFLWCAGSRWVCWPGCCRVCANKGAEMQPESFANPDLLERNFFLLRRNLSCGLGLQYGVFFPQEKPLCSPLTSFWRWYPLQATLQLLGKVFAKLCLCHSSLPWSSLGLSLMARIPGLFIRKN